MGGGSAVGGATASAGIEMGGQVKKIGFRKSWKSRLYALGLIRFGRIALGHFFAPRATVEYPEEQLLSPPRYRGLPRLLRDEMGRVKCTACHLCAAACPSACIHIEGTAAPWKDREKYPEHFEIDLARCISCEYCADACPEEAIVMSDRRVVVASRREDLVFDKERLLDI